MKNSSAHRLSNNTKSSGWIPGVAAGSNYNNKNRDRQEEIRRIRLKQQEELDRLAKEAAARKKEELANNKTDETKKPKRKTTKPISSRVKPVEGFNPMQPWSASTGGGGYR